MNKCALKMMLHQILAVLCFMFIAFLLCYFVFAVYVPWGAEHWFYTESNYWSAAQEAYIIKKEPDNFAAFLMMVVVPSVGLFILSLIYEFFVDWYRDCERECIIKRRR